MYILYSDYVLHGVFLYLNCISLPYPTTVKEITEEVTVLGSNGVNGTNGTNGTSTSTESVVVGYEKSSEYSDAMDRLWEQRGEHLFDGYTWDIFTSIDFEHNGDLVDGDLRINSYGLQLWGAYMQSRTIPDMIKYYAAVVGLTLLYATYDIGSFFLPLAALWEVVITVPYTWFLYNWVFGVNEFGGIQATVIFVLFAVGVVCTLYIISYV